LNDFVYFGFVKCILFSVLNFFSINRLYSVIDFYTGLVMETIMGFMVFHRNENVTLVIVGTGGVIVIHVIGSHLWPLVLSYLAVLTCKQDLKRHRCWEKFCDVISSRKFADNQLIRFWLTKELNFHLHVFLSLQH